jgi:hypothetical protein
VISPNGKFLYTVESSGNISWWLVTQGSCGLTGSGSIISLNPSVGIAVTRASDVLVNAAAINAPANNIRTFTINSVTGVLSTVGSYTTIDTDSHQFWPVASPVADYVYFLTNGATVDLYSYSYTGAGVVAISSSAGSGGSGTTMAIDPFGRFLFQANGAGVIKTWPISGGTIAGSPAFTYGGVGTQMYFAQTNSFGTSLFIYDNWFGKLFRYPYSSSGAISSTAQSFTFGMGSTGIIFVAIPQP